jgi:hypothetical protein
MTVNATEIRKMSRHFSPLVLARSLKWQIAGMAMTTVVPKIVPERANIISRESLKYIAQKMPVSKTNDL